MSTTFADGSATSEIQQGEEPASATHAVTPDAVVLPDFFFGAYEALAARLHAFGEGGVDPGVRRAAGRR